MIIEINFNDEKPVYINDSENFSMILKSLISGYNGWQSIFKIKDEIPLLKETYDLTMEEMRNNGNCGISACLCSSIRELIYDLKWYKEHEERTDVHELKSEIYSLKRENEKLKNKLNSLKELL